MLKLTAYKINSLVKKLLINKYDFLKVNTYVIAVSFGDSIAY